MPRMWMVVPETMCRRHLIAEHPDMFDELRFAYYHEESPNGFIYSLAEQLFRKAWLSEKQVAAYYRGKARLAEVIEQRNAEAEARKVNVDLQPIRDMFETAVSNGYKRPVYRAEGLVINRAPDTGRNPGALYVKTEDGDYMGKILGTDFTPIRSAPDAIGQSLTAIAMDPEAAAIRWGRKTGKCSCCGRKLTNAESIERGIGPICADRWGF